MSDTKLYSDRTTILHTVSRCSAVVSAQTVFDPIDRPAGGCFSVPCSLRVPVKIPQTPSPWALYPLSEVLSRIRFP